MLGGELAGNGSGGQQQLHLEVHPRAIAALGADLVTSDIVALIELIKNSYDAQATEVRVTFGEDESGRFIDVVDNGEGMTFEVIEDVWLVVATPYRANHAWSGSGARRRRASGAKGLGRLATARLGGRLEMVTRAKDDRCWSVEADWRSIAAADSLSDCTVKVEQCTDMDAITTGTRVRIRDLSSEWTEAELDDVRENLSRLVSPFQPPADFSILLDTGDGAAPTRVEPPVFMSHPKYRLEGSFDSSGTMTAVYTYESADAGSRTTERSLAWTQVLEQYNTGEWATEVSGDPNCGPFSFEIRVWDIGTQDTAEIADRWDIAKGQIRKAIRAHKGLSVYRDGILVLPKSENARDWLGLDLRRVSKTGVRISTSQIVGNVQIGAEPNPRLIDTSDRERLVSTAEYAQFRAMLFAAIGVLETERAIDRTGPHPKVSEPTVSFFRSMSAQSLVKEIEEAVREGTASPETLAIVEDFSATLDETRFELERRFVYYSRLATVGTIAHMLMHEIRNRTNVLRRFVDETRAYLSSSPDSVRRLHDASDRAVASLDRLASTFSPLANLKYSRGKRESNLRNEVEAAMALHEQDMKRQGLVVENDIAADVNVAIDPGELDAILVNLVSNAVYWLNQSPEGARRLRFSARAAEGERVVVTVSDSGPGVRADILNSVMEPGFTLKPNGIGMGLTVAAEVVSDHGGRLGIASPGGLGGATLQFDLPSGRKS